MKDLTDIELKKASIIDLTDDLELMRSALDDEMFEAGDVSRWSADGKMLSLFDFAQYTEDSALGDRLENIFEAELAAIFNE